MDVRIEMERMEVDGDNPFSSELAFDGTRIYPLGKDVYFGVQQFNNGLSYIVRVSNTLLLKICLCCYKTMDEYMKKPTKLTDRIVTSL